MISGSSICRARMALRRNKRAHPRPILAFVHDGRLSAITEGNDHPILFFLRAITWNEKEFRCRVRGGRKCFFYDPHSRLTLLMPRGPCAMPKMIETKRKWVTSHGLQLPAPPRAHSPAYVTSRRRPPIDADPEAPSNQQVQGAASRGDGPPPDHPQPLALVDGGARADQECPVSDQPHHRRLQRRQDQHANRVPPGAAAAEAQAGAAAPGEVRFSARQMRFNLFFAFRLDFHVSCFMTMIGIMMIIIIMIMMTGSRW